MGDLLVDLGDLGNKDGDLLLEDLDNLLFDLSQRLWLNSNWSDDWLIWLSWECWFRNNLNNMVAVLIFSSGLDTCLNVDAVFVV